MMIWGRSPGWGMEQTVRGDGSLAELWNRPSGTLRCLTTSFGEDAGGLPCLRAIGPQTPVSAGAFSWSWFKKEAVDGRYFIRKCLSKYIVKQ